MAFVNILLYAYISETHGGSDRVASSVCWVWLLSDGRHFVMILCKLLHVLAAATDCSVAVQDQDHKSYKVPLRFTNAVFLLTFVGFSVLQD